MHLKCSEEVDFLHFKCFAHLLFPGVAGGGATPDAVWAGAPISPALPLAGAESLPSSRLGEAVPEATETLAFGSNAVVVLAIAIAWHQSCR
jgi:hypothetical protein